MKTCSKWYQDFERTKKDFTNVDNLIFAFKNKHENINHLFEWLMGIFVVLFLSISLGGLTNSQNNFTIILGYTGYIVSAICLLVSIILYIRLNKIQTYIISDLYREKDKREEKKK